MGPFPHRSVLLAEVLHAFESLSIVTMIDGTLGAGGHAQALLEQHPEIQHYIGIDQDPHALALAAQRLSPWSSKVYLKHGNFSACDQIWAELALPSPTAILVDLGVSSMQLDQPQRGFSFMQDGPLDMRMNPDSTLTAEEIVNTYSEQELGKIFREYGEERQWRLAARVIVQTRKVRLFSTTKELRLALTPILARYAKKGIHPLTLIFQALRICVNQELQVLDEFLPKAIDLLAPGGRLVMLSFHSLEDRLVKTHLKFAASDKWDTVGIGGLFRDKEPIAKLVNKKPIQPSAEEIHSNPRSRSAKLRILEKLLDG